MTRDREISPRRETSGRVSPIEILYSKWNKIFKWAGVVAGRTISVIAIAETNCDRRSYARGFVSH